MGVKVKLPMCMYKKIKIFDWIHTSPVLIFLPCEATTRPKQVHKGNTNKTVYVEDQVGFLRIRKRNQCI